MVYEMEIKLLIIIVTYNSATDIRRCIEGGHLIENEKSIVISDNCSADDTAKIARELGCEVILNENNLGYSKAINKAVEVFGANDYSHLLILNPDAFIVDPINFNLISSQMDLNDVATIKMISSTGEERINTFRFPRLSNLLLNRFRLHPINSGQHCKVESLEGSFLFLSLEAFKNVQGFDQNIFLYGEDYEFCYRLSKISGICHFFPDKAFIHDGGFNSRRKIFVLDGLIYFFKKHRSLFAYYFALAIINAKKIMLRRMK